MIETPRITETTAQNIAVIHLTVPREEIINVFGPAIEELVATLVAQGMPPTGPAFDHHLVMNPDTFDFEVGFITDKPVAPAGRVRPGQWPAQKVARTTYHGPYEGLGDAWGEFSKWLESEGLTSAEDLWQHFLTGPHISPDSSTWRTDLIRPLLSTDCTD